MQRIPTSLKRQNRRKLSDVHVKTRKSPSIRARATHTAVLDLAAEIPLDALAQVVEKHNVGIVL